MNLNRAMLIMHLQAGSCAVNTLGARSRRFTPKVVHQWSDLLGVKYLEIYTDYTACACIRVVVTDSLKSPGVYITPHKQGLSAITTGIWARLRGQKIRVKGTAWTRGC